MATRTISNAGGNWNSTSAWVEGVVPTSADDVVATSTSGNLTLNAPGGACRSIDLTNYTKTFTVSGQTLTIGDGSGGKLKLVSGMTLTTSNTSLFVFAATSDNGGAGWPITTAGKTMPACTFDGVGGRWTFQDAFTTRTKGIVTLNNGYLDTNGKTCSWDSLSTANTNTRTLALGASTVSIVAGSGGSTPVWDMSVTTGLTFLGGTSTIVFQPPVAGQQIIDLGSVSGSPVSLVNVTLTSSGGYSGSIVFASDLTTTGTLTFSSTATARLIVQSATDGVQATINPAAVSGLSYVNFTDIAVTGTTAPWSGTALGNACVGSNSGITFAASRTLYWIGTTGGNWSDPTKWSLSSGGSAVTVCPLPQDDVVFDANSISAANKHVVCDMGYLGRNLDCSAVTHSPHFDTSVSTQNCVFFGNLTLGTLSDLMSGTNSLLVLRGRGAQTIRTNGQRLLTASGSSSVINIFAVNGSYTMLDNLDCGTASFFRLQSGTFDDGGHNVTCAGAINSTAASGTARTIKVAGTWTLTGAAASWSFGSVPGMVIDGSAGTGLIDFTDASSSTKTFHGGSNSVQLDYTGITVRFGSSAAGTLTITGLSKIGRLHVEGSGKTVSFQAGLQVDVVTELELDAGTTVVSTSPGTQATIMCRPSTRLNFSRSSLSSDVWVRGINPLSARRELALAGGF